MRTSEQIQREIEQTFGFLPPFFEPALPTPHVLENLWQQTLSAYVQSPLPALFKERLNAYLSRYCIIPYCMVCHSSALRPLGMTAPQVLALLETPPPAEEDMECRLSALDEWASPQSAHSSRAAFPEADSPPEQALIACATAVFLEGENAGRCREQLSRVLDPELYNSLSMYLAYIKTCHTWVEMHPEISYEADRRAQDHLGPLLAEEPALADFFRNYRERTALQRVNRAAWEAADEARRTAQAHTERILESIADAFFSLDTQWRFTYLNAEAETLLLRPRADLIGKNLWEEFPAAVGTAFDQHYHRAMDERAALTFEEYYPPPLDSWYEVRAYPSADGGLAVYFHNINERKAMERERERLADREHAIAERLQTALQPPLPRAIPGMRLAKYYEAALSESNVGGDFYDAFPLDKGCTALVVGDLSGKGLAAAVQVATVRNMLRAMLYVRTALAEAVTDLNRILALNGLISGFATLFVGCYDGATGELAYANLGQEPALVRRARTGVVEELAPTGPVLGAVENAAFGERTVTLARGDALAIFTDGLTEVGPSRREMLGLSGVSALLQGCPDGPDAGHADARAEQLAVCLVGGVDAYARGGVTRDDMCLLVGVVG